MLERVIHRHDVEAAGRERGILHEAGRDRHAERLARVARVLFVGLEARRVEAELPQHVDHLAAAGAGVENAIAALQIRCERAIAIQRAAARPGDVAQRRRRVPLVVEPVLARIVTPHLVFSGPRVRPHEPASPANRRAQRVPVAIAIADHLDVGRAAEIAGDRALSHDSRPERTAAAPTRRENSSASGRTSAAARARTSRPEGDP